MIFPKKLKKGDTVGLVCTSSFIKTEKIGICVRTVESMGYKVKTADNLDKDYGGYMAGGGKLRAGQLNRMFEDNDVNAIFCVRGGYGSSRIMEYIDYDMVRKNPKIFVGYSDVTNLHIAFIQKCQMVTFHGPMVHSNMIENFDIETEKSLLKTINADSDIEFKNPEGFDIKILHKGKGEGRLTGGNLSLLSASIGTPYEIETEKSILFVEEVNEPIGKIEKWVWHLRDAGKLKKCNGIILGQFSEVRCSKVGFDAIRCFYDALEGLDIPIFYNIQSGHGKPMMTLPLGTDCYMDSSSKSIKFSIKK